MALSQRPASRFFAAFYRWNLNTQRPYQRALSCQHRQDGRRYPAGRCLRKYHPTRLLREQSQPESQLHNEGASAASRDASNDTIIDKDRIVENRPVAAVQEEASTEQKASSPEEISTEFLEPDREAHMLKQAVRSLFRKVPSSVAVITVEKKDPDIKKHVPMGVAVSSLTSVTLDPPTISFNIKQPSKTLDAIRAAKGLFRVHFPGATQQGVNVIELFCRGNHTDAYNLRCKDLKMFLPTHRADPSATASLAPQIWNDSIRAALECTITHEFSVADHVIIAARVDSVEQKMGKYPTIVYVDGTYMRSEFTIAPHGVAKVSTQSEGSWSVWDFPLCPGDQERKDYLEHIKTIIKGNPAYLDKPSHEAYRDLALNIPCHSSYFGINLASLLAKCRQESGRIDESHTEKEAMPILFDFYGRLSSPARANIMDRAKRFVRADSRFLSLNYPKLLQHLSVDPGSSDLLPSDIMIPLRAEGLVGTFERRKAGHGRTKRSNRTDIERVEQVEHQLRDHFRYLEHETAVSIPLHDVMETLGEEVALASIFGKCRSRLVAEAHPRHYDVSKIDIVGEVTQEEARVALNRIINFLQITHMREFRKNFRLPPHEVLRLNGVHPTITGMDIEYLWAKISHLYYTTQHFRDFAGTINKMLEPWFDKLVEWDDLVERVKQFVQRAPMRATAWSKKDKLAAIGLHKEAIVMVPIQNNQKNPQPLIRGPILDTLVAKELKNQYGNGTEEENRAIAKYLKETYSFDVHSKPIAYTPQDSANRSSSDDMEEAMLASLNVDVLNQKHTSPIRYFGGRNTRGGGQDSTREKQGARPPQKKPVRENSSKNSKKDTVTEWTTYSLDGAKN